MGTPKPLLRVGGTAMAERVVAAVAPFADDVVLLGDGVVPDGIAGLPRLADVGGLAGPLAGMLAAVRHRPDRCWLFAACDMPLLDATVIGWLLARRRSGTLAVVPLDGTGRPEPLLSVWEPAGRSVLEALAVAANPAPRHAVGRSGVDSPRVPARLAGRLRNVNSASDLTAIAIAAGPCPE